MVPARLGMMLVAACCALACGNRPDPPGPALSGGDPPGDDAPSGSVAGAGSASGGLDRPDVNADDDVGPDDANAPEPADEPTVGASVDAGVSPAAQPGDEAGDDPAPVGGGQAALGCTEDGGGCLIFNIAVADSVGDSCIQLVLDNCESSQEAGLRVGLSVSWRLGAASVSQTSENCVPGAPYDPRTTSTVVSASGSIDWNEDTRLPSEVVVDVTLRPASSAVDAAPIRLTNSDLVESVLECD